MAEGKVAVRLGVEGAEDVRAALVKLGADGEAALKRLNFDTSAGSGGRAFTSTLEAGSAAARDYASELGPIGGILSNMGGGWLAAGAAAGGFIALLGQAVTHSEAYAASVAGVNAVLRATQDASGLTADDIEGMAERISDSTLQTRESVLAAAQTLLAFGIAGPDAFERTLGAAADLAASPVFHGDLALAVKAIASAAEGQFKALQLAGDVLSEAQKEQIKNFDDAGDHAAALNVVLSTLAGTIGGQGTAQDQGVTGASHALSSSWDKLLTDLDSTGGAGGVAEKALRGIANVLDDIDKSVKSNGLIGFLRDVGGGDYGVSSAPPDDRDAGEKSFDQQSDAALKSVSQQTAMGAAHQRATNNAITALTSFGTALDQQAAELRKPKLQQAIDDAIKDAAQKAQISPQQLRTDPQYSGQLSSITSGATKKFNAQNAGKVSEEAQKYADYIAKIGDDAQKELEATVQSLADQNKALEAAAEKLAQANAAQSAAENSFRADQLKGQDGYYAAVTAGAQAAATEQQRVADAQEAKEIAGLEAKKTAATLAGEDVSQIEQAETNIHAAAAAQRVAITQQESEKELDIIRQQQGALGPLIAESTTDWNQGFKTVAADGLNDIQNGLIAIGDQTEKAGAAFDKLVVDILNGIAKMVLQKTVIAPAANFINSQIDGGFSGVGSAISSIFSADGNAFERGHVVSHFADGGAFVGGRTVVPLAEMGEAGPEAILPLQRGPDGKLGIGGAGGGATHFHYSPQFVIGGTVKDSDLQAVRDQMAQDRKNFPANVVRVHNDARSRGVIR